MSLEKEKNTIKKSPIVMPVCPYCKTEMRPFDYRGYYDSFVGWECSCEKIPKAEKQFGQYA
jgi:hypothetical protein